MGQKAQKNCGVIASSSVGVIRSCTWTYFAYPYKRQLGQRQSKTLRIRCFPRETVHKQINVSWWSHLLSGSALRFGYHFFLGYIDVKWIWLPFLVVIFGCQKLRLIFADVHSSAIIAFRSNWSQSVVRHFFEFWHERCADRESAIFRYQFLH